MGAVGRFGAARPVGLRVDAPEFAVAGQDITIHVTPAGHIRQAVRVTVTTETGTLADARILRATVSPGHGRALIR